MEGGFTESNTARLLDMECLHVLPAPVAQSPYPLFVNREDAPAVKLPESIGLRGFNTRGYTRPGHELSKEGHALRDKIDAASKEYLSSQGCTVIGRHSAPGSGLKGAVSAVELEAFSYNYKGFIKVIEETYGRSLQKETLCLPSLSDGMVLNTDTVLVSRFIGGGPPLFTTFDLLCINPKTCYETHPSYLYRQLTNKQQALTREGGSKAYKRLDDRLNKEAELSRRDPEQYPDAIANVVALQHLRKELSEGLVQALHVVAVDPICDIHTLEPMADYLGQRVITYTGAQELPGVLFVGAARAPLGATRENLESAMLAGHEQLFNPSSLAEAVVYRGEVPQGD